MSAARMQFSIRRLPPVGVSYLETVLFGYIRLKGLAISTHDTWNPSLTPVIQPAVSTTAPVELVTDSDPAWLSPWPAASVAL